MTAITLICSPIHEIAKSSVDDVAVHSQLWLWKSYLCDLESSLSFIVRIDDLTANCESTNSILGHCLFGLQLNKYIQNQGNDSQSH